MPQVMTVEQVAKYLQLNEQTVYRKVRDGEIPVVHIGKVLRFKRDIIDEWMRITSLRWSHEKRESLRKWGAEYVKDKGLHESDLIEAVRKRRYAK